MTDDIYSAIKQLLRSDPTVTAEHRAQILNVARNGAPQKKRRTGTVRQAAEILSCHPKTVYRYARRGHLKPIHYSPRKVRFDLEEVEAFAANGLLGRGSGASRRGDARLPPGGSA